jgi:hypothetical protein
VQPQPIRFAREKALLRELAPPQTFFDGPKLTY